MHERVEADDAPAARVLDGWFGFVGRHGRAIAVLGAAGVLAYIASWVVAGLLWPGYSPVDQAISETFATGAPAPGRILVTTTLVVSGLIAVAFASVLHLALPRSGHPIIDAVGPVLATGSGVFTVAVAAAPCTLGCPGAAASAIDAAHTLIAGTGYVCLVLAPAGFALRLRRTAPRAAAASAAVTVVALVGFGIHVLGLLDAAGGLVQRTFNTVADLWYVAAAVAAHRRLTDPPPRPAR